WVPGDRDAARRSQVPKVVYTSTLAVKSDTEEQAVDETYRGHRRAAWGGTGLSLAQSQPQPA
ncbi:MAG TPA: hypothetical protein VFR88_08315, partial [Microlunatus sp.]|nr:hypothetical protein [Microlunatus sp.]